MGTTEALSPAHAGRGHVTAFASARKRAYALTKGDRSAADVLERILYWWPKAEFVDGQGSRWLIRTAEEFLADGLNYSLCTIRRALKRLAGLGLIAIKRSWHRFRRAVGRMNCTYIQVLSGELEVSISPTSEVSILPSSEVSISPTSLSSQETFQETKQDNHIAPSGAGVLRPEALESVSAGKPPKITPKERREQRKTPGIAELMEMAKRAKAEKQEAPGKLNAETLHRIFQAAYRAAWPGEIAPDSQPKRLRWLKQALEKLRAASCTDQQVLDLINMVVANWSEFRIFGKARGAWQLAERPQHLDFLRETEKMREYVATATISATTANDGPSLADFFAQQG